MTWIPLGPTLVTTPRVWTYSRVARANEYGAQCAVLGVAVHPADERNVVVVTRRVGGSSAFRTLDDGHSWTAIADDLTRANPQLDLACAALHPSLPDVVYLGALGGRRVLVSTDGGRTWPLQRDPGGAVTRLIVDRRSGADWRTATLYAATDVGVATSIDGGDMWTMAAIGEVTSLTVYMPSAGPRRFYAGVYGRGLLYATAPDGPWQNLFGAAPGLPPVPTPGAHMTVLVDYSPRQPDRVYILVAPLQRRNQGPRSQQVYVSTAAAPGGAWAARGPSGQPALDYTLEGIDLMVAPEPYGLDADDVLLCTGGIWLWRSTDGGRTWDGSDSTPGHQPDDLHHSDVRSLAHHPPKAVYYPEALPAGPTPPTLKARVYVGSDGGLGASRGYTDPTFNLDIPPGRSIGYNSGPTHDASLGLVESLDHGLASVAAHQYAGNPDPLGGGPLGMIGYLSALDTGTARHIGSLTWQSTTGGDVGLIFASPQADGVRVWGNLGAFNAVPSWKLCSWLDRDPAGSGPLPVGTAAAEICGATSNMVTDGAGGFYAGILALEEVTTLRHAVAPGERVDVFPVLMTPDFVRGARVCVGDAGASTYRPITDVFEDHFTVDVVGSGPFTVGAPVRVVRCYVAHVSGRTASRISQVFIPQGRRFYRIARASGDTLLAATADQRLWTLSAASTAGPASVWTEVSGRPADLSGSTLESPTDPHVHIAGQFVSGLELQRPVPLISSLTADAAGALYVMLSSPVSASLGSETLHTPLFRVMDGAWIPERCALPPAATIPPDVTLGRLIAHPTQPGRLYVSRNARVYQLDSDPSGWIWTDLTDDLPGQEVHDLWVGNIAAAGTPTRLVLRATTAVRGVWELEIAATQERGGVHPYFRDHAFDPGWTGRSVDGVVSPLNPTQRFYHWQSADIKVDAPLRDSSGALYYQNDPEAPSPTPGDFAWIKDRSQAASAGTMLRIWVRVNNRSTEPSGPLSVWALTCPYSGALPALPAMFWSRFHADGSLDSSPPGGRWTSLGVQPVDGIHAEAPGIVGFTMPSGAEGDHRCILVFVHGPGAPLDTAGLSMLVDEVVPANRQIAQRNVIVTRPLPPTPRTPPPSTDGGWPGGVDALPARIYVELNNPEPHARLISVHFDLRDLPPALSLRFRLASGARPESISGAKALPAWSSFVDWLIHMVRRWLRLAREMPGVSLERLPLSWRSYEARGGGEVVLRDLALPPGGRTAAELWLEQDGDLEPGHEHHVDVLQFVKQRLVGGATLILPVAGDPRPGSPFDALDLAIERDTAGEADSRPRYERE